MHFFHEIRRISILRIGRQKIQPIQLRHQNMTISLTWKMWKLKGIPYPWIALISADTLLICVLSKTYIPLIDSSFNSTYSPFKVQLISNSTQQVCISIYMYSDVLSTRYFSCLLIWDDRHPTSCGWRSPCAKYAPSHQMMICRFDNDIHDISIYKKYCLIAEDT